LGGGACCCLFSLFVGSVFSIVTVHCDWSLSITIIVTTTGHERKRFFGELGLCFYFGFDVGSDSFFFFLMLFSEWSC
jgi:hypothetical protein